MAKVVSAWVCENCGADTHKWSGQCPHCKAWNSLQEFKEAKVEARFEAPSIKAKPVELCEVEESPVSRMKTAFDGIDRLFGGGIVPGSLTLLGGEPGIGKSTLLTQVAANLAGQGLVVLYICGEESTSQVSLRAKRLGIEGKNILLLSETRFEAISSHIDTVKPDVVIVDSIQVLYKGAIPSAPGSLVQVRELSAEFMHIAKGKNISHILVGHVTKSGEIAGPKVLEHIVDTVVYFEADVKNEYRLLRVVKNRFGPSDEIAVFQMKKEGLVSVNNPSELFMQERSLKTSGSVIAAAIEGTRPFLVEIQALVTKTVFPTPSRRATGFDTSRLALLIAVMEKRAGFALYQSDIFLSVAGGLRLQEPAVDLGVVLAIASSFLDKEMPADAAVLGEVGLGGEVRAVSHIDQRLKEAMHLGFTRAVIPKRQLKGLEGFSGLQLLGVSSVSEAIRLFF